MAKTVILFNMYRGFSNELNANNCFINAVLQVILLSFIHRQSLFHLPQFRVAIRNTKILHPPRSLSSLPSMKKPRTADSMGVIVPVSCVR